MKLRNVAEFGIIDAIIIVWGLAYLVALFIRPGMYADFSLPLSMAFLGILGVLLVASVFLDRSVIYFSLSVGYVYGFIISWTGIVSWNVSYDPSVAAASMAIIDFFIASILMYKALCTSRLSTLVRHPQPERETAR